MNAKWILLLLALGFAPAALADEAMAKKAGCLACHKVEGKLVGPGFKEIAAKYRGQGDALAKLTEKVRKGGKDAWGPVPMPPNPVDKVADADLRGLVQWILKN